MANERNPPWSRDELILALELFFRHRPNELSQTHPEIVKLSQTLNRLPIHSHRPDAERFRNGNGVYMKLSNFLRFDPDYGGAGLSRGGKAEEQVWNDFVGNREELRRIAHAITVGLDEAPIESQPPSDDGEESFHEGQVLYRMHRYRERNSSLVQRVKLRAVERGLLACEVCDFDFGKMYGAIGQGFIECHHTVPVSEYEPGQVTRAGDLALVCSNCHRMLHRVRPWLTVEQLRVRIRTSATNCP